MGEIGLGQGGKRGMDGWMERGDETGTLGCERHGWMGEMRLGQGGERHG